MTAEEAIKYIDLVIKGDISAYDTESTQKAYDALDMAKEVLEKQIKYGWHDLRKNPEDLPEKTGLYLVFGEIPHLIPPYDCEMEVGYTIVTYAEYRDGYHFDGTTCDDLIIAWREIEPFEGENDEGV